MPGEFSECMRAELPVTLREGLSGCSNASKDLLFRPCGLQDVRLIQVIRMDFTEAAFDHIEV